MLYAIPEHPLHLVFGEPVGRGNLHRLGFAAPLIVCRDVENTVGIDEKGHFDARYTRWLRLDAGEREAG